MMLKRGRALDSPAADDIIVVSSTATPSYRTPFFNAIQQNLGSSWSISNIQNIEHTNSENLSRCVIFEAEEESRIRESDITWLRRKYSKCFIVIYQPSAVNDPVSRLHYFEVGVNMVGHDVESVLEVLHNAVLLQGRGSYVCPYCSLDGLTEDELWRHTPAYHINSHGKHHTKCPICRNHTSQKPLQVHIHDDHGPIARARRGRPIEEQASIRCYSFSLVVCRHPITGLFLLCQEFSGQGFWLPGGAVDAGGETYATAAQRETMEEAGVDIELKGILQIEHSPSKTGRHAGYYVRQRVIYYAEPADPLNCIPKSIPDFESAGACWVSLQQMEAGLQLRGSEPLQWARYLLGEGDIYPLAILSEKES